MSSGSESYTYIPTLPDYKYIILVLKERIFYSNKRGNRVRFWHRFFLGEAYIKSSSRYWLGAYTIMV